MTGQNRVDQIEGIVCAMIARCDEIASCETGGKMCNMFLPREARKTVDLVLNFIAMVAQAPSMASIAELQVPLIDLQERARIANVAVANCLPSNCCSLIACISSGEQFYLNLLLRGDSAALSIARILRPLAIPVRQLILIFAKKLQEQLTVGASTGRRER